MPARQHKGAHRPFKSGQRISSSTQCALRHGLRNRARSRRDVSHKTPGSITALAVLNDDEAIAEGSMPYPSATDTAAIRSHHRACFPGAGYAKCIDLMFGRF